MNSTKQPAIKRLPATFTDDVRQLANATVQHRKFVTAREQCLEHLASPADSAFVFLVGAAGSGKTRLLGTIYDALLDEFAPLMRDDPDVIPVLRLNTPAPVDGTFRWRAFGSALFEAARSAERGRASLPFPAFAGIEARARTTGKPVDEVLRDAMGAVADRGVRVILLDEAGHLANVAFTPRHRQQLDVVKGLALDAGVRFLLAGPYELLSFRDASAQLGRRSRLVHAAPYTLGRKQDRESWAALVATLLDLVDAPVGIPDIEAYLFAGSLGCVGLLRDWLVDAEYTLRRRAGRSTFDACLREKRPTGGQLRAIRRELVLGLHRIADDAKDDIELTEDKPKPQLPRQTSSGQPLRAGDTNPRRRYLSDDAA